MSEAAEAVEATTEASEPAEASQTEAPALEEVKEFNFFEETPDESEATGTGEEATETEPEGEAKVDEAPKEKEGKGNWSARVRKDRQQRQKEIELKRKTQELIQREELVKRTAQNQNDFRRSLIENPEEFFRSNGIDPYQFYEHWTSRMATGDKEPSAQLQNSATQRELEELKEQLAQKESRQQKMQEDASRGEVIRDFYKKIDDFKTSNENFPLTSGQCSAQDIAEGMSDYWKRSGVELSIEEAFQMIEKGLQDQEQELFDDPATIARFKKHHGIEEAAKVEPGKTASKTLSSKMAVAPTKQAPEDMSHDEIIRHWSGKIYT